MKITGTTRKRLTGYGYNSLSQYFKGLAEEYGIHVSYVIAVAEMLGENELFDGLLSILEDEMLGF